METRLSSAAFSALAVGFRVVTVPILFFIGCVEKTFSKYEYKEEEDENPDQRFNFALAFANGQRQDVVVSGTDSLSETKKMKLLLDINVLPDRKFEVVSARNLSAGEKKMGWLPWDRFVEMMAYYLLKTIKIIREILHETEVLLESCTKSYRSVTVGNEAERKRISPKKRISKSRIRYFKRYLTNLKRIVGLARPEGITFDPIEGVADTSLNGSLNGSKIKPVEKRKHPTDSEHDSDYSEDEGSNVSTAEGDEQEDIKKSSCTGEAGLDSSFSPAKNCSRNDRKKDYFEVDEDYKSAEDPDYIPSAHNSSSDTDLDEAPKEELEIEQRLLKEDLTHEINGKY